jgi:uncharacterized phage protein (TIGR01671 family)
MREIKFRACDIGEKLLGNVNWLCPRDREVFKVRGWFGDEDKELIGSQFELMQYTGLKDMNGKEIYEGDIIKVLDRDWSDMEKDTKYLIVYYSEDKFILINEQGIKEREKKEPDIYNKEWYETRLYKEYGRDRFEVIGNIYENPELLVNNPLIEESDS